MSTSQANVTPKSDAPVSLLDGCLDSLHVKRADATEVDDLSLDALLGELVRGLNRVADHLAVRNDGHVAAVALNLRLADGEDEVVGHGLGGHGEGDTIQELVLEEYDGVGVADGSLVARCLERRACASSQD